MKSETVIPATFGQKFLSRLIDFVLVTILASLMLLLWSMLLEEFDFFKVIINTISRLVYPSEYNNFMALMIWGYVLIGFFIYYPILESTGGTWGKRIVGVRTVGVNESKTPKLPKSVLMALIFFLTFLMAFLIIGVLRIFDLFFIFILFSILPINSLHHKLTRTLVIKK